VSNILELFSEDLIEEEKSYTHFQHGNAPEHTAKNLIRAVQFDE
jgi:hypothetical protein